MRMNSLRRTDSMYRGKRKVHVAGVLFLHRISDNRFSQTADRISTMLKNLCGDAAMSHLMLCTTMWDRVPEEEGYERYNELCETDAWKEMISKGAATAMISNMSSNAKAEAERIVNYLLTDVQPVELAIQNEMVNQAKEVAETSAGIGLDEGQEKQANSDRKVEKLHEILREGDEATGAQNLENIRLKALEVETLKVTLRDLALEQQAQAGRRLQEREKAEQDMKLLRDQMRETGKAVKMKAVSPSTNGTKATHHGQQSNHEHLQELMRKQRESLRARKQEALERKKQESKHAAELKTRAKRLQKELRRAERALKELRSPSRGWFRPWDKLIDIIFS